MFRYPSLIISLFCLSAYGSELSEREILFNADLKRQLPQYEIIELPVAGSSFLALYRENMTSYTKGTAIIVPDLSEHAASPKHLDLLRQQLNDYGWHTLSIMLPADNGINAENTEVLQPYLQQLKSRMQAALDNANQHPGTSIVIAQGNSAALLSKLYAEKSLPKPAALILLGAYLPDKEQNRLLAAAITTQPIPTLDINHSDDNHFVHHQLRLRQQLAQKNMKAVYRQRMISGSGYQPETQQWVLKEITGWLSSIGF